MKVVQLLLSLCVLSMTWMVMGLHKRLLGTTEVHSTYFLEPMIETIGNGSLPSDAAVSVGGVETVLIIATVPYDSIHVSALWSHLECVLDGIDRVLVAAPDTPWSREIIASVLGRFEEKARAAGIANRTIDAAFFVNDRYDAGLWCDALALGLGFDGYEFPNDRSNSSAPSRAIFLINDSAITLRLYRALTDRVVRASRTGGQNFAEGHRPKLVSLNGNLVHPGGRMQDYWVESVYRGFVPGAVEAFYEHTCAPEKARLCAGKEGNSRVKCIVNNYEISLAGSYAPGEVDAMYPTYLPAEWDAGAWEEVGGRIGPKDQWIRGRRYFRYLVQEHDFPFRKIKWPQGQPAPPRSGCMELLEGNERLFDHLPFPSDETLKEFQEEMLKLPPTP